jgi:hypothetical protein
MVVSGDKMHKDGKKIGLDLDGTSAQYSGYKGQDHIGEPYKELANFLKEATEAGHLFWIYTARESHSIVQEWLERNNLAQYIQGITSKKEHWFDLFIDDRAFRFEGIYPTIQQLNSIKPWWKNKGN